MPTTWSRKCQGGSLLRPISAPIVKDDQDAAARIVSELITHQTRESIERESPRPTPKLNDVEMAASCGFYGKCAQPVTTRSAERLPTGRCHYTDNLFVGDTHHLDQGR